MFQKRLGQYEDPERTQEIATAEVARLGAESATKPSTEAKSGEESISLFWRVFGGTILSIITLVAITLFNNMWSTITEIRTELNREREARAEMVKKEEFNSRITQQYERIRTFDSLKVDLEGLRERVANNGAAVDGLRKDSVAMLDGAKKELALLSDSIRKENASQELLKERVVALEGVKKELAGIELVKDRLMTLVTDYKVVRDELSKVQQDVERNKAGDLERKAYRDGQQKQIEDALKELQKGLQDCREKLVRLEVVQPMPPARVGPPSPEPNRSVPPADVKSSEEAGEAGIGKPGITPPNGGTSKPGPEENN